MVSGFVCGVVWGWRRFFLVVYIKASWREYVFIALGIKGMKTWLGDAQGCFSFAEVLCCSGPT